MYGRKDRCSVSWTASVQMSMRQRLSGGPDRGDQRTPGSASSNGALRRRESDPFDAG